MRRFLVLVVALVVGFTAMAYAEMQQDIDRAATIVTELKMMPEQSIPPEVLVNAKGLAILTMGKAGFILSARGGGGVIVARTPNGDWSAPSSIVVGGLGLGLQAGLQATDFVLVMNSQKAVDAFLKGGNATLGGDLSVSAGPIGRTGEADVGSTAIYAYSRSAGVFAGVSLEGTILEEGKKTNELFYGKPMPAGEILSGKIAHPASANALYESLKTSIPQALPATAPKAQPVAQPAAKPAATTAPKTKK